MYLSDSARMTLLVLAIGWFCVAGFAALRSLSIVGLWEGEPQLRWVALGAFLLAVVHLVVVYSRRGWVGWASTGLAVAGVSLGIALLFVAWPLGTACCIGYGVVLLQKLTDRPDSAAVEHVSAEMPRRRGIRRAPWPGTPRQPPTPTQPPVRGPGQSLLSRLLRWLFVHPGRTRPGRGELETHRTASVLGQDIRRWRDLEEQRRRARDAKRRRE